MNDDVLQSYRHCRQVARGAASNLAWAFWLLPAEQRRSMDALYAFARKSDDLADEPGGIDDKRRRLSQWRGCLEQALDGKPSGPLFPALADTIARHRVPPDYLRQIVTGVEMDLDHQGYETFAELRHYCEHVASAVGLACLAIWDCRDERAMGPATDCGVALQLTNILRDLVEDAALGRSYLPREDVARLGNGSAELIRFECARAKALYDSSAETERFLTGPGRRLFKLMHATYRALLAKIERDPARLFAGRQRVSRPHKAWLAVRTLLS
jgi:phytoene synthase